MVHADAAGRRGGGSACLGIGPLGRGGAVRARRVYGGKYTGSGSSTTLGTFAAAILFRCIDFGAVAGESEPLSLDVIHRRGEFPAKSSHEYDTGSAYGGLWHYAGHRIDVCLV